MILIHTSSIKSVFTCNLYVNIAAVKKIYYKAEKTPKSTASAGQQPITFAPSGNLEPPINWTCLQQSNQGVSPLSSAEQRPTPHFTIKDKRIWLMDGKQTEHIVKPEPQGCVPGIGQPFYHANNWKSEDPHIITLMLLFVQCVCMCLSTFNKESCLWQQYTQMRLNKYILWYFFS